MSNDIKIIADKQDIVAIANAVRNKTGATNGMTLGGIVNGINGIQVGVDLPELTNPASEDDLLQGKELIDEDGNIVTGTMPTATQATPSITVNSSGLITATATQSAGYVAAGTKSATKQLTTKSATTITPTSSEQVAVSAGTYVTGDIKVGAASGGSGSTDTEDAFVTCTLTEYTNDRVTSIGKYAFYSAVSLTTISFPNVTSIGSSAFTYCSMLTTVSFPVCKTINQLAFGYCSKLTAVSFPKVTSINYGVFYFCTSLTTVSFPVCTSIGSNAFSFCTSLTTVSFPVCTSIGSNAFYFCTSLTTVSFPVCASIGSYAFRNCRNLLSLYLNAGGVCTLTNSNAFSSTPIAGYTTSTGGVYGSIFVPASLVDAYKTATNWTYFADRIAAIEE